MLAYNITKKNSKEREKVDMNYYFVMLLVIAVITSSFIFVGVKKDYIRNSAMSVPVILLVLGILFVCYL